MWANYVGLYLAYSSWTQMGESSIAINIILEGGKKTSETHSSVLFGLEILLIFQFKDYDYL